MDGVGYHRGRVGPGGGIEIAGAVGFGRTEVKPRMRADGGGAVEDFESCRGFGCS